VLSEGTDNLDN